MCHHITLVSTVHAVAVRVGRLPQLSVWLSVSSVAFDAARKISAGFTRCTTAIIHAKPSACVGAALNGKRKLFIRRGRKQHHAKL